MNKKEIEAFIEQGRIIGRSEYQKFQFGDFIEGPQYSKWMHSLYMFLERNLKNHPLYANMMNAYRNRKSDSLESYREILLCLEVLLEDGDFFEQSTQHEKGDRSLFSNKKVFIVHGHDEAVKYEVAHFVENLGLGAIILHEQVSAGQTIIEKIEANADVGFAIILYTPCDEGKSKNEATYNLRARQNVVFEHGYFVGKLGRERVCPLMKEGVQAPGDMSGVVYTSLDPAGGWKNKLINEMNAAGYNIDKNLM